MFCPARPPPALNCSFCRSHFSRTWLGRGLGLGLGLGVRVRARARGEG